MSKNDKKYTYKTLVMSNDINREGPGVGFLKAQSERDYRKPCKGSGD